MSIFKNPVYEQQRINIEEAYKEHPDNWFYQSQINKEPNLRVGFSPVDGVCPSCHNHIAEGHKAVTLKQLGSSIITGCPYCNTSFCN